MGGIANCIRCQRMFQRVSGRVCPDCIQAEEERFRLVRDHIEANPGCGIAQVSEATGVEESEILHFLQSGRLATLGDMAAGLRIECQQCARPIATGKLCPSCQELMSQALRNSARQLHEDARNPLSTRRAKTVDQRRGI